jgi:nicotinamide-nucleotide amidase
MFPRGSRIIPNPDGTAPGIDLDFRRPDGSMSRIFALPGVPSEMRVMWNGTVSRDLLAMQPEMGTFVHRRIKCFGAGESALEEMLPDLIQRGRDPLVGITAHEATITLRIVAQGRDEAECLAKIAPTEATILECLGQIVYGREDDEVEDAALRALVGAGATLGTIEIATEGRVAAVLAQAESRRWHGAIQDVDGAAAYRGGAVWPAAVASGGPLDSADAVRTLAERARTDFGAAMGLAVGAASPGSDGRSMVRIALSDGHSVEQIEHVLGGGRALAQARATKTAIDLVRRKLEFRTASS